MVSRLQIYNFKGIQDLSIYFTPFTIIIGNNACGKSTVLQALDLLSNIVTQDIDVFLKERGWVFEDIKSQLIPENRLNSVEGMTPIRLSADIQLDDNMINWTIAIEKMGQNWYFREMIIDKNTGEVLLSYRNDGIDDRPESLNQMIVKSSALKLLSFENIQPSEPMYKLMQLKEMLISSHSFELLSPDRMRRGSRGNVDSIGMGGENLSTFIKNNLNQKQKKELSQLVSEFINYPITISTTTKGKPGWVELLIEESWPGNDTFKINKNYISDGLLRIIALCAIIVNQSSKAKNGRAYKGFILLDEIEDGINPDLSEKLIGYFSGVASGNGVQIIITSHSPVMVNYALPAQVQYMWRDKSGKIHAAPMDNSKSVKEAMEFLSPGEIWLNYSTEKLIDELSRSEDKHND